MKRVLILMLTLTLMLACGCSSSNNSVEPEPDDLYADDAKIYLYTLDTTKYVSAIEDIIYYDGWDIDTVNDIINQHIDVLSDSFVTELRARATELHSENTVVDVDEGMIYEEFEPGFNNGTSGNNYQDSEVNTGDVDQIPEGYDENGEYVGLGDNPDAYEYDMSGMEIDDIQSDQDAFGELRYKRSRNDLFDIAFGNGETFGSTDDSDEVYGGWFEEDDDKVYSVVGIDAYPDRLIASVTYKYGSPLKVWVGLENEKITGYLIYR